MITYGEGLPTDSIESNVYVDLLTDFLYQKKDGEWVITHKNGEEVKF